MKIKEIFYSLQGEGAFAGRPAIFVRFAGCNLACPFCDTDFKGGDDYTEDELVEALGGMRSGFVVFTGGEPTLQLTESIVNKLHRRGYYVAMETNGTRPYTKGVDWVTVSPKNDFCDRATLHPGNSIASEVKVVFTGENDPEKYASYGVLKFIQPCDTGDPVRNEEILRKAIEWVKENPKWRLSLQTQKIINVR